MLQPDQADEERGDPGDADEVERDGVTIPELPSLHRRDGTWRASAQVRQKELERAAGFEPATTGLEGQAL